ncbi:Heart- and neural crest derivatives-expressed protein 2 [Pseudolycoriella hygida]|uniref:Heart- and neural crest derivatives-expressed protein 2 n=1 Tax=Pseudolycoriella hygida TaxID=35572 RepID=A0A9Q0MWU9_9DIPT|nr:Heart- and neural crest derivatives-expressed protein 2 [Pseudolycoriella hygida]
MSTATYNSDIDICQRVIPSETYYEPNGTYYTQIYSNSLLEQPEGGTHILAEEGYWGSPCSSDSNNVRDCSPSSHTNPSSSPYHQYAPVYYPPQYERPEHIYDEGYYGTSTTNLAPVPFVRVVKRRTTANKKERRRTQSINSAFSYLRDCIPNVPSDTKLSKIKTLRLATSYISYLTRVLEGDQDPSGGFRAELVPSSRKINAERRAKNEAQGLPPTEILEQKKGKGRTGWPQHVWASELKQEQ